MYVLVINAGSSSLKYQLFDMATEEVFAKGLCDRIAIDGILTHQTKGKEKYIKSIAMPNHSKAIEAVLKILCDKEFGCIDDLSQIIACGHRIVHGGEWLTQSVLVNDRVIEDLEKCRSIAPLHTGPHLMGLRGCMENMPTTPQVLVIDTAYHQSMPAHAYMYPIPYALYEKYKIRRYGFHGTSHRYVATKAIEYLGKPAEDTKIITCHLGNGSSISAILGGKVIDTSMGFTPLEGVIMGSRSGDIDPAIVPFIMEKENIPASEMGEWLNKKCGLLGVSGVSSDLRDIDAAIKAGNERAKLAFDILCYDIKKYIGAYTAALNGLDAIVFTAGIGENNVSVRYDSLKDLEFFGIKIDKEKNENFRSMSDPVDISTADSKVRIYVIPTNEELVIARDTMAIVSK
ncbi:MAG: acetate kinase [Clostridiales bacterium GWF2_38_85]|nr:MAG: acetate kinase [Clostridiales bacterium GWF2_38_85]HBL84231.1 acetate kinase [Clostridiales bacterium]